MSYIQAVGPTSLNDTIMGRSGLLILGLVLHVAHCSESLGKSAGLQSICGCQLFMSFFNWPLRSF